MSSQLASYLPVLSITHSGAFVSKSRNRHHHQTSTGAGLAYKLALVVGRAHLLRAIQKLTGQSDCAPQSSKLTNCVPSQPSGLVLAPALVFKQTNQSNLEVSKREGESLVVVGQRVSWRLGRHERSCFV